jgi:hypothetical protein
MSTTHVILFSGGINDFANYSRYAEDLRMMLKILEKKNGVSRESIQLLYGPGGQTFYYNGTPITASTASKKGLTDALTKLTIEARPDDHTIFISTNHGGQSTKDQASSYLWCWGADYLTSDEFASLCKNCKSNRQSYIFQQCFSGGFVPKLASTTRVILAACEWNEVSYASSEKDKSVDEFLFRISEAVQGKAQSGGWRDIFDYARSHDKEKESPLFSDLGGWGHESVFNL